MSFEIVYYNGGEVYKRQSQQTTYLGYAVNKNNASKFGKQYLMSVEYMRKFASLDNITPANVNIATLPWPIAQEDNIMIVAESDTGYEVYYATYVIEDLRKLLDVYKLGSPISVEQESMYDDVEQVSYGFPVSGLPFIMVSIKFTPEGVPTSCKLYTYSKAYAGWGLWMSARSYVDGAVSEYGQVLMRSYLKQYKDVDREQDTKTVNVRKSVGSEEYNKLEFIMSKKGDFTYVYKYTHSSFMMNWAADVYDKNLSKVDTKVFRPSNSLNRLFGLPTNSYGDYSHLSAFNKVRFWLGESYHINSDIREYYFAVVLGMGGIGQITKVAKHYNLPLPYTKELEDTIVSNPKSIRAKYVDMLMKGPGHYVPVVVCGVVFIEGEPSELVLYTFNRPFETEEDCEVIKDYSTTKELIAKGMKV